MDRRGEPGRKHRVDLVTTCLRGEVWFVTSTLAVEASRSADYVAQVRMRFAQ